MTNQQELGKNIENRALQKVLIAKKNPDTLLFYVSYIQKHLTNLYHGKNIKS